MTGIEHLLIPAITAVFLVMIYLKAGLVGPWLLVPVLPFLVQFLLIVRVNLVLSGLHDPGISSDLEPYLFVLAGELSSLLPLAVLASVSWHARKGRPVPAEVSK